MATKKAERKEYACVVNDSFYTGATLREAYENAVFDQGHADAAEGDFYEVRKLQVEFQVVEKQEPVCVG
jgi:hypothetical protein